MLRLRVASRLFFGLRTLSRRRSLSQRQCHVEKKAALGVLVGGDTSSNFDCDVSRVRSASLTRPVSVQIVGRFLIFSGRLFVAWCSVTSMGLRSKTDVPRRQIDLQELAIELCEIFDMRNLTVYLFGSRKDKTGSVRSDVDILVELPRRASQEEMDIIWNLEPYLDVFALDKGTATSLVNESQLRADTNEYLIAKVGAVCIMRGGSWVQDADEYREQVVLAERNPAASFFPLYDLEDAVPAERADLLVVTALTKEYDAVVTALGASADGPSTRATLIDDGKSPWKIRVLNLHEMGSVGAALKTAEAMRRTKPSHVVLAGICGGIPGRSALVDVVVPESILYYEPGKVTPEGLKGAYDSRRCDSESRTRISVLAKKLAGLNVLADGEIMACGEKVIADEVTRDRLVEAHRKLAAVDMESYGVVRAAGLRKVPVTVIKSVCDLSGADKSDDLHDRARAAAARVFVEAVRAGAFRAVK